MGSASDSRRYVALGAGAAAVVASLLVLRIHGDYARTVAWAAASMASFVGWGTLVNRWVAPRRRADWGLRAGWGMAATILSGGYLCLLHLAGRPVFIAQVALGAGILAATTVMDRRPGSATRTRREAILALSRPGLLILLWGGYALGCFMLLAYMGDKYFQPSDDPPLYLEMAEKLMQSGSFFEPFNSRRISTFGGQVYLHASFLSAAPVYFLHVVDAGLGCITIVGLLTGHVARPRLKLWHGVPLALALTLLFGLGDIRVNTASILTGMAAVLVVYRTVRFPIDDADTEGHIWPVETKRIVLLGLVTVASIVLRTPTVAVLLPFLVLVFLSDWLLATREPWTRESLQSLLRAAGLYAATFVVALLPWSVLFKLSCGTFFYPLGQGNLTPGFVFLKSTLHLDQIAQALVTFLFWDRPISVLLPFFVAALLPLRGRERNDLALFTVAVLIGLVTLAKEASAFEPYHMSRYYSTYTVPMALMVCATVRRLDARAAVAAVAVSMHIACSRDTVHKQYEAWVRDARDAFVSAPAYGQGFLAPSQDYLDVQSHVPEGAAMATAVHEGFRFDFKRNTVYTLDLLGGMGPAPGWPTKQGGAALGDYLLKNGVQYLVYVDFNLPSEFYNRAHWRGHLSNTASYLSGEAPYHLDGMDAIEELTKLRKVVYQAHGMTVVDLQTPA